jgi:hypothetical protein
MFTVLTSTFYLTWNLTNFQLKDYRTGRLMTSRNFQMHWSRQAKTPHRNDKYYRSSGVTDASSFRAFLLFPHFVYNCEEGNNMFFQNVGNSCYCNVYLVLKQLFTLRHDFDVNLFAFITIPLVHTIALFCSYIH